MNTGGEAERRAERLVGTTVHDKYKIERVLGVGGMATVFLAVHRNGHKVALKMLHPEVAADPDMRARFVREGYAANSIEHRGVVRVLDDDVTDDGVAFLVMELLAGETLHARARRSGGRLTVREVLALGHQLLGVLAAAHARGILHRDVKPENLFLTRDGVLKVLDFGIARIEGGLSGSEPTRTGRAMGTPAFMSPEQAFGRAREIDARSDLWGAGATLFQLLTAKHVHEAENAAEMLVYAATKPAPSIATVDPSLPACVVSLVDRALAFEKADRWPGAREMQEAIAVAYAELYDSDVTSTVAMSSLQARSALESAPTIDVMAPPPEDGAKRASAPTERGTSGDVRSPAASAGATTKSRRKIAGVAFAGAAVAAIVAFALLGRRAPTAPGAPSASAAAASASTSARAECAANAACAPGRACRAGRCVALESEDCRVLARPGDVANDATVWVGAMFATEGPMASEFTASINGVELARRDFQEISNGLPSVRPGGPPRPLGVVLCNDGIDPARAARHLIDDVGVAGVVGFSRSKEVADLTVSFFNPRGVLALASNTATMLSSLPSLPGQPRMVWRTTTGATVEAPAIAALVRDVVEPRIRARGVAASEPIRVALVCFDNASGLGVSDAIVSQLRFNGKSVAENGTSFRQIAVPASDDARSEIVRRAPDLAAFAPHVVIDMANGDVALPAIEAAWPARAPRPTYVLSTSLGTPEIVARARADADLRRRVFGVETVTSTPAVAKFVLRYNEIFSPKVTALNVTGAPYDAMYALAYAIVALGEEPITGPNLARALRRLAPPGAPIDVGPAGIYRAFDALGRGDNIDLVGTVTSLDFDATTGDPSIDLAVFCLATDRGDTVSVESGMYWRGADRKLSGAIKCP